MEMQSLSDASGHRSHAAGHFLDITRTTSYSWIYSMDQTAVYVVQEERKEEERKIFGGYHSLAWKESGWRRRQCHSSCLVMQESEHRKRKKRLRGETYLRYGWRITQQQEEGKLIDVTRNLFAKVWAGNRSASRDRTSLPSRQVILWKKEELRFRTRLSKLPLLGVSVIIFLTSGTSTDSWRGILAPEDDEDPLLPSFASWNFITLFLDLWWAEEEEDPLALPSMT